MSPEVVEFKGFPNYFHLIDERSKTEREEDAAWAHEVAQQIINRRRISSGAHARKARTPMARLSREFLKDQINQAVFDALDELEAEFELTIEKEAQIITDAVFNVLTETDDEDLSITELLPGNDEVLEENVENYTD